MSVRAFRRRDWEKIANQAGFQPRHMASICRISLRQLERDFEQELGKTPIEWSRELRCRLAVKLIAEGYTNKAVVTELKFASPSHLCHEFKKVYGDSPRRVAERLISQKNVAFGQ